MDHSISHALCSAAAEPCVAAVGACRIRRGPAGGYLVSHQACPERSWLIANLPTAHALCVELQQGHYGCCTGLEP